MKRTIALSTALILSIATVFLIGTELTSGAPAMQWYGADTGVITLGPNQLLRVTVAGAQRRLGNTFTVTFGGTLAVHGACNDNRVCIHTVGSRTTADPVILRPGTSASFDIRPEPNSSGVRGDVLVGIPGRPDGTPDVEVNALIIDVDPATGEIKATKATPKLFLAVADGDH